MAKKMGIPLGKLCSGVNVNDITHRVMQTGAFHSSPCMLKTLSDAINIQIPYNFERILFYVTEQNDHLVREWMTQVETTQKLDLSTEWLEQLQQVFDSARISDEDMCTIARQVWSEHKYLMDPHTAVAMGAAETLGYHGKIAAVFATASPCKFEESVTMAVGKDTWNMFERSDQFPASARTMLLQKERPPTIYQNDRSLSLRENQRKWEEQARQIVATLENIA
jgi:threonine synthase